ncbi:MAG: hypothetical protein V4456_11285 [Bacteroidota bacterium]
MGEDLPKDKYFELAKPYIKRGEINDLFQLYSYVPKKSVAQGLGLNSSSFSNFKSNHPEDFKVKELIKLAELLDVDVKIVFDIFLRSIADQ